MRCNFTVCRRILRGAPAGVFMRVFAVMFVLAAISGGNSRAAAGTLWYTQMLAPKSAAASPDLQKFFGQRGAAQVRQVQEVLFLLDEFMRAQKRGSFLPQRREEIAAQLASYAHPRKVWDGIMALRQQAIDRESFDQEELWAIIQPTNARIFWYGRLSSYIEHIPDVVHKKHQIFYPGRSRQEIQNMAEVQEAYDVRGALPAGRNPYQPQGSGASAATNMDRGLDEFDINFGFEVTRTIAEKIRSGIRPKVLIIGAGRGTFAYDLFKRFGDRIEVVSLIKETEIDDFVHTPRSLWERVVGQRRLRRDEPPLDKAGAAQMAARIRDTFEAGDAAALPFDDQSFDMVVIANGTFVYFADKLQVLEESRRVLAQNGRGYAVDIDSLHIPFMSAEQFFNSIREETFVARRPDPGKKNITLQFGNRTPAYRIPLRLVHAYERPRIPGRGYIPGMIDNRCETIDGPDFRAPVRGEHRENDGRIRRPAVARRVPSGQLLWALERAL